MKQSLFVLAMLFASTTAVTMKSQQNETQNLKPKALVEIELNSTAYESERSKEESPLSDEYIQEIQTSFPQGAYQSLIQNKQNKVPIESDLINMKNMGYDGKFWFGNPSQEMSVIFDTGSSLAWLFSEKCTVPNCPAKNKRYSQSKSSDFKEDPKHGQMLKYGKGQILGHPSADRACFGSDQSHCVPQLTFLTVVKSADLAALRGSGLIGLGPSPDMYTDKPAQSLAQGGAATGFVSQLSKSAEFKRDFEPMFSFYLSNDETSKGRMIFGGYDLKWAKGGSKPNDIFWAKQSGNTSYWATNGAGVSFGQQKFETNSQQFILDNGMSFAMAPEKSFAKMVIAIQQQTGIQCFQHQPVWGCMCDEKSYAQLPDIKFSFVQDESGKTKDLSMPKESYMMYKKQGENEGCFLLMTPWKFMGMGDKDPSHEYWVLGAQFLHNYYSIYDFQKHQIGLVESVTSKIGTGGGGPSKSLIKVGKGEKGDAEKNESGEKANIGSAPKNSEE